MRIHFDMVGCRVNEAEIEMLSARAVAAGWRVAAGPQRADWIVINTCTVTRNADRDSRRMIRRAHARNPAARLAVTGCWATMNPARAAALPGVAQVIPNSEKEQTIAGILNAERSVASEPAPPGSVVRRRTRAHIKVQEGCGNACAYCITRLARGRLRSRPAEDVAADVLAAQQSGVREAVLTGVHLGAWGRDLGLASGLERLIATVLARTAIPRVRLSSVEPWDVRPEFFRLWEDGRLCPHLHLPLQSGCAATLRRMRRNAMPEDFAGLVDAARAAIPDLAVTSDLMVGFPGETESEFGESLEFVRRIGFARLHVFPFSARPGTEAAGMPGAVPDAEVRRRAAEARRIGRRSAESFARGFLGRELEVLWERGTRCGMRRGLTDNYLRVKVENETVEPNTITRVRMAAYDQGEIVGRS
jgi:threonylcarbamoyladenosine tRNA methylthiotransferase MtaB